MKSKISAILGSFILALFFVSCGPTKEDAINYNDKIIKEQKKVIDKENDLIGYIKGASLTRLDEKYNSLSKQIDESTEVVKKMEAFDGKTDFKDATLELFLTYRSVVDKEYKAWMINLKTPGDKVDQKILDEENDLVQAINEKLDKAQSDFTKAQYDFAAKYKFEISKY